MRNLLGMPAWLLRAAARLLLVALSVSAFGPVAHGVHDDECDVVVVVHDEARHHVQAAAPADDRLPADHCVACHFARSSRGPVSWEPSGLTSLDGGVLLYHADGRLRAALSTSPVPARAPPSYA
jgi:hypothetical protein